MFFPLEKGKMLYDIEPLSDVTAVPILGAHRSGTSLVSRLLNLCSLFLGDQKHMIPATPSNPMGHWELKVFVRINDRLLNLFCGSWDHPPRFPRGWEYNHRLNGLYRKAKREIQRRFNNQPYWGWKDPRLSLTLPFWKRILSQLKPIICVRHPLDVARSLELRNGIRLDHGLRLWLEYTRSALEHTLPDERLITHYENYFASFEQELLKLVSFIGLPQEPIPWKTIRSTCSEALWHHRTGARHGGELGHLPRDVAELYRDLLENAVVRNS